jgi:hypothetical protein
VDAHAAAFAVTVAVRLVLRQLVVGFAPACQNVGEVREIREPRQHLDRPAAVRADHRGELRGVDPQLRIAVVIDVQFLGGERFALPQHALGDGELTPDRIA